MKTPKRIPKYRLNKASGRAVVTLSGRDHYLGKHGTIESQEKYHRLIAEWIANGRRPTEEARPEDPTVTLLIAGYWRHAQVHYRKPDGTPTASLGLVKLTTHRLNKVYGMMIATDFGPLAFKALRQTLINDDLTRKTIERYMGIVKQV